MADRVFGRDRAILIGTRPFVSLIGSTAERAHPIPESIKTQSERNELLLADGPEVVVFRI